MSEQTAMIEHDLDVNGITLHYMTWGELSQPERTVLLIHGLTASSQEWSLLGPALAEQGWYAIAPDLRGRGLSSKPSHGYGIPYHANDLLGLCDALGLSRVHVIGHSLGALIGLFLAAIHPARIGKLVLVDAGGKIPEDALQTIAASLKRLGQVYPSLDAYLEERKQTPVHTWNPFWEAYYRYDAQVHPDGSVTSRVSKAAIDEENAVNFCLRTEVLPSYVRALTLIARAALGVLGPEQGLILTAEEAERVRGIIPNSRLVTIPNSNHYTIILAAEFRQAVLDFLAGDA